MGQDKEFTAASSADWNTAGNWSPTGVPTGLQSCLVENTCNLSSAGVCGAVIVDGVTLDTQGFDFTVSGAGSDFDAACTVKSGGTLDASSGGVVRIGESFTDDWGLELSSASYLGTSAESYIGSLNAPNGTTCNLGTGETRINGYKDYTTFGTVVYIGESCTFTQGGDLEINTPDTLPCKIKLETTTTDDIYFIGATTGTSWAMNNTEGQPWACSHNFLSLRGTFDCSGSDIDQSQVTHDTFVKIGGAYSTSMSDALAGGNMSNDADATDASLFKCGSGTHIFGNEAKRGVSGSSNYALSIETNGGVNFDSATVTAWASPIQGGNGGNSGFWGFAGVSGGTATITIKGPTKGWWSSGK